MQEMLLKSHNCAQMYVKLASNENELRMPYIHAMQCGNTHVRSMSEREIEFFFSLRGDIVGVFCL